jgi:hypothetical protein
MRLKLAKLCLLGSLLLANPQENVPDTTRTDSFFALRDSVVQQISMGRSLPYHQIQVPYGGRIIYEKAFCKHLNVEDKGAVLSAATCRTLSGRPLLRLLQFRGESLRGGYHLIECIQLVDWDLDGTVEGCSRSSFINGIPSSNEFIETEECLQSYYPFLRKFNDAVKAKNNRTRVISSSLELWPGLI